MQKVLKNLNDTKKFATEFLQKVLVDRKNKKGRNVILLQGELGAGKTTFSQFFLKMLGAEGPFTSPTFVIMKKYGVGNEIANLKKEQKKQNFLLNIYHLDCYRVDKDSVLDLGWEEIIANKNNIILVEWPEKISEILPQKYWLLKFKHRKNEQSRLVEVDKI
jgi:tRNA threonylcarbamoyladenosine biosynthesis protein TsaE